MTLDAAQAKKRLLVMALIDGVCMAIAAVALVGVFMFEIRPLLWLFALAIGAGLATQIWFIAGLKRTDRGV